MFRLFIRILHIRFCFFGFLIQIVFLLVSTSVSNIKFQTDWQDVVDTVETRAFPSDVIQTYMLYTKSSADYAICSSTLYHITIRRGKNRLKCFLFSRQNQLVIRFLNTAFGHNTLASKIETSVDFFVLFLFDVHFCYLI